MTQVLFAEKIPAYVERFTGREVPLFSNLVVEITSRCNLICPMCPKTAGFVNTPPDRVMGRETFLRLEPSFPHLLTAEVSGLWGEAFLQPDLYAWMLGKLKEHGIAVRTISNGTLITEEVAEMLVRDGLDFLTVSVDAARPDTYAEIRKGGSLPSLLENLRRILRWKERYGKKTPHLQLAFLGMVCNIRELPDFVRLAKEGGAEGILLQAMGEYAGIENESLFYRNRELGRRIYEAARVLGEEIGVGLSLFPPDQFSRPEEEIVRVEGGRAVPLSPREDARKDCTLPWDTVIVATNGDVYPCCAAPEPIGNVNEKSLEDIWYSEAYNALRAKLIGTSPPKMCLTCTGIGWRKLTPLSSGIAMGEEDGLLAFGWHGCEEAWGSRIRWTAGEAAFFLKNEGAGRLLLETHASRRVSGSMEEGGRTIGRFRLSPHPRWRVLAFPLPESTGEVRFFRLRLSSTFRTESDPRDLGIAVRRIEFAKDLSRAALQKRKLRCLCEGL